jgi:hypothetical protein
MYASIALFLMPSLIVVNVCLMSDHVAVQKNIYSQLSWVMALACWLLNLLGLINPGEEIPKGNLVNRLLDLIKGTNLFTQE